MEPSNPRQILNAPNCFRQLDPEMLGFIKFFTSIFVMLGLLWMITTLAFYLLMSEMYSDGLYESRWLLSPVLILGVVLPLFYKYRYETFFISILVFSHFTLIGSIVVLVTYSINISKASSDIIPDLSSHGLSFSHPSTVGNKPKLYRQRYMQTSCALLPICLSSAIFSAVLLYKMSLLAVWHYRAVVLSQSVKRHAFFTGLLLLSSSLISLLIISHVMSIDKLFTPTYIGDELHCTLSMLLLTLAQMVVLSRWPNVALLKALLVLWAVQFVTEMAYTWNAYIVTMFLQTTGPVPNPRLERMVMPLNFCSHFFRLMFTAYLPVIIYPRLSLPLMRLRITLTYGVTILLKVAAVASLVLAIIHVLLDIIYTTMRHVYREIIAFTGITLFYTTQLGITISVIVRTRLTIFLCLSLSLACFIASVSLHGLYVYFDVNHSKVFNTQFLEQGADDRFSPVFLYFIEAAVALISLIFSLICSFMFFRLLTFDASRVICIEPIKLQLSFLFWMSIALALTAVIELCVSIFGNNRWVEYETTVQYNVCDFIYMISIAGFQLYVSLSQRKYIQHFLVVLMFMLGGSIVSIYSHLNVQTSYLHIIIAFLGKIQLQNPSVALDNDGSGPVFYGQLGPIIVGHVIYILQWFLMIGSIHVCGVLVEKLYSDEFTEEYAPSVTSPSDVSATRPFNQQSGGGASPLVVGNGSGGRQHHNDLHSSNQNDNLQTCFDNPMFNLGANNGQLLENQEYHCGSSQLSGAPSVVSESLSECLIREEREEGAERNEMMARAEDPLCTGTIFPS